MVRDFKREILAGTTDWQTNKAAGTTYLYMNVEDAYINDNTDSDIQVAVTYYDAGNGSFRCNTMP